MCDTVDFTTAFARLLVDPSLRRTYRHEPAAVASQLAVAESQREAFCNLDPDNLERQAAGLISKRRYEVAQIIPDTWARLKAARESDLFRDHAIAYWPTGHQRHQQDAFEFCRWLIRHDKRLVVHSEFNWLRFRLSRHWLRIHCTRDMILDGRLHSGIQFCYRWRGKARWYAYGIPKYPSPVNHQRYRSTTRQTK